MHSLSRGFRGINALHFSFRRTLFGILLDISSGSHIAKRLVPALPVVEALYVPEDILPCFDYVSVGPVMQPFRFDGAEEGFGAGIVPAVPFATHTPDHALSLQFHKICFTTEY